VHSRLYWTSFGGSEEASVIDLLFGKNYKEKQANFLFATHQGNNKKNTAF
jgi:hypothetical protein